MAPPTRAGAEGPAPPGLDRRYRLEEKLGQGAMGIVYRGHDQVLDRPVALKRLAARLVGESVYSERFRQEARALARLSHPHIVQVFDLIAVGEEIWMVLEYLDGGSLADYLKTHGRLEPAEAARMICGIADGLAVAHREGIIHRDIKPANILLTADRRAKLSDFGIAKLAREATLTQAGSTLGSPAYMSPEQCSGEGLDERSDIYSLGITLYELLAGRPPFAGETSGILAQHLVGDPAPLAQWAPGVPEPLDRLVRLMLAKRREDRPQMMAEVAAALDGWTERTAPVPGA
ncbi:MAG: serine/threonine-protein kinase [candidate division Zixibacteria bacterium]|nr:serine/threonine-protein kinase [candidate division Zixibacteria bacterium]